MTAKMFVITTRHCGELGIGTSEAAEHRLRMLGHRVLPMPLVEALAKVNAVFPTARVIEHRELGAEAGERG